MGNKVDMNTLTTIIIVVFIIVLIYIIVDYFRKAKRSRRGDHSRFIVESKKKDKKKLVRREFDLDVISDAQITINPHFKVVLGENNRPLTDLAAFSGYTPSEIRNAYGLTNISLDGTGETIAIIDAFTVPTVLADFATFDSTFKIGTPNNLTVVPLGQQSNDDWGLETNLDVQWVHAIAPGAKILLVQAADASIPSFTQAIDYAVAHGATVISMSWGTSEFVTEAAYDKHLSSDNVIFTASAGDVGGETNWPSVSSNVISVGGTTLDLSTDGVYVKETGWSGGGGGPSVYVTLPAWQQTYGLKGNRQTPDISCIADPLTGVPVYNSFGYMGEKGWFQVGGTSLSSPLMAGMITLANQGRTAIGKANLTNVAFQNYLYGTLGVTPDYSSSFNDITIGKAGAFSCTTGYDNITGLGTPDNSSGSTGFIADLINVIP
jgi:subtilase family serine protease/cbb3-type cytochrome oxidase subunit 3